MHDEFRESLHADGHLLANGVLAEFGRSRPSRRPEWILLESGRWVRLEQQPEIVLADRPVHGSLRT